MTTLNNLTTLLSEYLETERMQDYGPIGLQVEGTRTIEKVGFAVSANLEAFKLAKEHKCQAVITHHGLFWKNNWPFTITGVMGKRVSFLTKNDISLLSYHLPLDCHPVVGNNAQMLSLLGARISVPFTTSTVGFWGWCGTLETPQPIEVIQEILTEKFGTCGTIHPFGPKVISTIASVTGGGSGHLEEAVEAKADLFITGELKEPIQEIAREAGIHVIAPGHYNTETLGVKALMPIVEKVLAVETIFLDVPNSQ